MSRGIFKVNIGDCESGQVESKFISIDLSKIEEIVKFLDQECSIVLLSAIYENISKEVSLLIPDIDMSSNDPSVIQNYLDDNSNSITNWTEIITNSESEELYKDLIVKGCFKKQKFEIIHRHVVFYSNPIVQPFTREVFNTLLGNDFGKISFDLTFQDFKGGEVQYFEQWELDASDDVLKIRILLPALSSVSVREILGKFNINPV